jgi:hypothetical protein
MWEQPVHGLRCPCVVRPFAILVVLAGLCAPALACPPLDACVVQLPSTVEVVAERPVVVDAIRAPGPAIERRDPGEIEMPWIWRALREQVYSRMPTYEQENELKIVLAPVVVTSPSDTVPGVGVSGAF